MSAATPHDLVKEQAIEHSGQLYKKAMELWGDLCTAPDLPTKRVLAKNFMLAKKEHDEFTEWAKDLWRPT